MQHTGHAGACSLIQVRVESKIHPCARGAESDVRAGSGRALQAVVEDDCVRRIRGRSEALRRRLALEAAEVLGRLSPRTELPISVLTSGVTGLDGVLQSEALQFDARPD